MTGQSPNPYIYRSKQWDSGEFWAVIGGSSKNIFWNLTHFHLTPSEQFIRMVENTTYLIESEPRELKLIEKVCLGIPIINAKVKKA
jgi:hypothetical protein